MWFAAVEKKFAEVLGYADKVEFYVGYPNKKKSFGANFWTWTTSYN